MTELTRRDRWVGWGLFALTFVALAATQAGVGYVRDESVYFYAAQAHAGWFHLLLQNPSLAFSDDAIVRAFDFNHEHPALMKNLFGLSWLIFHQGLGWMGPAMAFRLPAFAAAAMIPLLLYRFGTQLYGRLAGTFAAVSFFLVPRQFFNAHLACFDVPIAAMWLLTVYVFWRAQSNRWGWLWVGVCLGLSLATKHNAFFLPVALAPMALYKAWRVSADSPEARRRVWQFTAIYGVAAFLYLFLLGIHGGGEGFQRTFEALSPQTALWVGIALGSGWILWQLRGHLPTFRALGSIASMAVLGPVVLYVLWPYLWHHPVDRVAWWVNFHAQHFNYAWFYLGTLLREPPFPLEYVFAVTAMTVPTSLMVPMATGLLWLGGRVVLSASSRLRASVTLPSWEEALVGINALASILLISLPNVPHFGGVKHWFPSMPFLALLSGAAAARGAHLLAARVRAFRPAWPAWATPAAFFALLWLPALIATARIYEFGTSYYAEITGGLPGAASLGMERHFWSNNVTGVLPWLNEHAPRGARVWFHEVTGLAVRDYQENGLLRPDIQPANGPEDAQIACYQYMQEFREQEFNIWQAFGTTKPVTGLYLDETPQIVVYRRP